jgi:hypothetical protein
MLQELPKWENKKILHNMQGTLLYDFHWQDKFQQHEEAEMSEVQLGTTTVLEDYAFEGPGKAEKIVTV